MSEQTRTRQIGACPHCGCPIYGVFEKEGDEIPIGSKFICDCRKLTAAMAGVYHPPMLSPPIIIKEDNTTGPGEPWPEEPTTSTPLPPLPTITCKLPNEVNRNDKAEKGRTQETGDT